MNRYLSLIIISLSFYCATNTAFAQHEKIYNLSVQHKTVNFSGKKIDHALAINGSIPAPTLRFKKGDIAVINVKNELHESTTLHWHGILLPWNMDGPAPYNNKLILPGETFTFRFPIKQTGTYWYHSHTMFQAQSGVYGAIVIEDEVDKVKADHDRVLVLSDWTNEHPMEVLRNIKSDGNYYAFKKKYFPSLVDAIRHGAIWDYIKSEWVRMGPMDLSDVGYDAFLVNGNISQQWKDIKPGEKVRLRVINAGASSYFYLNLGNLRDFQVIAKDGLEVVPVTVNEILMGMGETYDLLFTMPSHQMGVEFRATSMDISGSASLLLGDGDHSDLVPDKIRPSPYGMDHSRHAGSGSGSTGTDCPPGQYWDTGMSMCMPNPSARSTDDGQEPPDEMPSSTRLSYDMLKSPTVTEFKASLPRHEIKLEFTGDMERYNWYINGKPFSEDKYIQIKYNEVVRFVMVNKTMMHHPMHLHGHFFRVLNGQDKYSPNFHTVDVAPMATVTVEFWANEPGLWFFHCHNLYHMEMGMARLIKYENFELPPELVKHEKDFKSEFMDDSHFYPSGEIGAYTNHADLKVRLNGGRWDISLELELDKYDQDTFHGDIMFKRYLSQYLAILGGGEYEDQELFALLGLAYTLPLNVEVIAYSRSDGKSVIKLFKSIPIYNKLSLDLAPQSSLKNGEIENEFVSTLNYQFTPKAKVGLYYKNDDRIGHSVGFGFSIGF